jgi:hypothetical protein
MALRHLAVLLLPLALFSSAQEFKSCQLKYQVSSIKMGGSQAFAIDREHVLFYSEEEPVGELVKRDPFLGLSLIKSPRPFRHVFTLPRTSPEKTAAVLPESIIEGKMLSEQIGLGRLAQFSKPLPQNAIITGKCCGMIGISTPKGVIEKVYIRRFLENKEVAYGDIGIRLADSNGVRLVEVNPFVENSPFFLDDIIIEMNGRKAHSAAQISREILFSAPGSRHNFVIHREKKKLKVEALVQKKAGGGLKPDSFFNLLGLKFDERLIAIADSPQYEIKEGDRLLRVMDQDVTRLADVRRILSQEKRSQTAKIILLIRRSGFDFFISIPKPQNSKK